MAATTYATVRANAQSTVYGILNGDSDVTTLCTSIFDGVPQKIGRQRGTWITVNTPRAPHDSINLSNTTFNHEVIVPITISATKESVSRELTDAVIESLMSNQNTTRAAKLMAFKVVSEAPTIVELDNEDRLYQDTINVRYKYYG